MLLPVAYPEWFDQALCAQTDPEEFFPEKGESSRIAKKICGRCPVAADCLDYALASNERYGIWGGVSERDRRRMWGELVIDEDELGETEFGDGDDFTYDIDLGEPA